jgi:Flp pilus assembly protein TadB
VPKFAGSISQELEFGLKCFLQRNQLSGVLHMGEIIHFIYNQRFFSSVMLCLNYILISSLVKKTYLSTNKLLIDAMGGRYGGKSLYKKCISYIKQSILDYERRERKAGIYIKARNKMKKSGYRGEYAAVVYLILKYPVPLILFITSFIVNYPHIYKSFILSAAVILILEIVIAMEKKRYTLRFQKNAYKIYKYLHCQISSGVKVSDAVKTAYEVIEDKDIRDIFVQMAARYELTLDIDASLEELNSSFDALEADTLCIALKQGIMTGDNQELLARQEELMFNKYFNHIQAETDNCRVRTTLAAAMFTAIIVIMIAVPLISDVSEAIDKIFAN